MEQKVNNNMLQEDEIDLRELFRTIWKGKLFIIIFTLVVTILAGIYAYIKTPIYEVKATVRVGYIGEKNIVDTSFLIEELKTIFNVNDINNNLNNFNAIISSVKKVKGSDSLFILKSQSTTNKLAKDKILEVIKYITNNYNYKINKFKMQVNSNIKKLNNKINNINEIAKVKVIREIEKIKTQTIPNIQDQIDLIKKNELKSLTNKIKFNSDKLEEYEKNIKILTQKKSQNSTQTILTSIQLQSIQNLILSIQDKIENLKLEKKKLVNIIIKNLENKKKNLKNENIKDLKIKLKETLNNEINDLKQKIAFEKFKLKKENFSNGKIVGNLLLNKSPIKPKKMLIITVAFVTGFILSIFLLFFIQFIRSFKEENNE